MFHERHGRLPDTLQDLVDDKILPEVPRDLYGGDLRYSREQQLLWSVGSNGRDDGGEWEPNAYAEFRFLAKMRPADAPMPKPASPPGPERKDDWVYPLARSGGQAANGE